MEQESYRKDRPHQRINKFSTRRAICQSSINSQEKRNYPTGLVDPPSGPASAAGLRTDH